MKIYKTAGLLVLLAITIVFPILFSNPAVTSIAIFTLIFAAAATAWNIISGYTGYIALGHAAYFGIGAYALAIICQDRNIAGGYAPFFFVPVAGLIAAIISIPLGWLALRVRRHTFIVITIAMFFIVQLMAYNLRDLTNGSTGLSLPIPFDWFGPGNFLNIPFYYVTLAVMLLAIAISWWIRNSKFGLGLLAIRDDEDRAMGLGVRTGSSKLIAFIISALVVGMLGAIYGYFVGAVAPASVFDPNFDVAIALMAFLGGLGTLSGPLLGALILEPAQQYFILQYGANGYYLIIYGALFLLVVIFMPTGIIPTGKSLWYKFRETRNQRQQEDGVMVTALPRQRGEGVNAEKKEGINL
ncbi:MAG TPA: branched-chain amino acid ABC transporter permease [Ktedonobacteraceae bacterium]|nr:branched-chain amino acid ABC transporter permease [Ktedonobacteraceae bacterium]